MELNRRHVLAALAGALTVPGMALTTAEADTTARAKALATFLDGLGVETHWLAGQAIDWRTGEPDGRTARPEGRHTHCSAFVAAAAERLGIYILRPPEHGQTLLANAQNEWLPAQGRAAGWQPITDMAEAQRRANGGWLVVASYHNHRDDRPGHIVIVRPGQKSAEDLAAEGPDVIQAGTVNSRSIGLRAAFQGHPPAWRDDQIDYYAHPVACPGR